MFRDFPMEMFLFWLGSMLLTTAFVTLAIHFQSDNFQIKYVWSHSSTGLNPCHLRHWLSISSFLANKRALKTPG